LGLTPSFRVRIPTFAAAFDRAGVAKLVDALDLGSSAARLGGSSPSTRTKSGLQTLSHLDCLRGPDRDFKTTTEVMKIDFTRQDGLKANMTIVLEYSDYGPLVEKNTKDYTKKINMKGFRAGKTPKSVLQKMYGKGILEETISKMLNEKLFGYLDEHKIGYFGSPLITEGSPVNDFDPKSQHDYMFNFELGLKPDFTLNYHMDASLEVMIPSVDTQAVDESIIRYRRIFGEDENIIDGSVAANDRVGVNLQRIDGEGNVEESIKDFIIDLERISGEATKTILGQKLGDTLDVDLEQFLGYNRPVIIKDTLGLEEDPAPDQPLKYRVTITSIKRPQVTPLTGEQISKFVGRDMADETEFRDMLLKREMDNQVTRIDDMKKMVVRKQLQDANPFEVPEEFLLNWLNHQRDQQVESGSRQAKHFIRDTKWSLLLTRIQEDKQLEVTDKDVQKQVTNWVVQNVNYNQVDIRKYLDQLYKNEYFMSSMKENAMEEVVFKSLLPEYQYVEKTGTAEEFEKAFHDLHHELFDHGDHDHEHHHDHAHDHAHDHDHDHDHEHSHEHHEHSHR
jgi:trigger factor